MKPLAITLGDPAGIGAEVVFAALREIEVPARVFGSRAFAIGDQRSAIGDQGIRATGDGWSLIADRPSLTFHDVGGEGAVHYGEIRAEYGRIALASIDAALEAIDRGECSALVTAPIHKQAIAAAGATFAGHTELLAERAGLERYGYDYAMYFDSPSIRTVLLTVHVPLREALDAIDADTIAALAGLTARDYAKLHGKRPRIGVAAVNPHGGEGGRFGREEEEIAKGVAKAGDGVTGPHPADTLFLGAREGKYDVVMAMYHDQGLIPVKTLEFDRSVNITLGLPYLRVSVDHGTAFDIAGRGLADPGPMRYAIEFAAKHAAGWTR
ncbi:MAG TPA: 4-hydroxythreonine-4-phosphate dehydrogenase PdxA [Thermoanaerobaculia bacterium]|nr:4-hydroxythreonine-4-phosphate dehydrogenase PdxA [Thermoanaerobaculia bacterium]